MQAETVEISLFILLISVFLALTESINTIEYINVQKISRSELEDEHADLDLRCLHIQFGSVFPT